MIAANSKFIFDRDESKIVRGFAILAMVLHHTMALTEGQSDDLIRFGESMKICVAIFTFLVGYGFYFSRDKGVKAGMKRAAKLIVEYWALLFIIFIPIYLISMGGGKTLTISMLVKNLFGINESLHWFSWYVYFYIYAMAVMPFYVRICNKYGWKGFIGIIVASILLECIFILINRIQYVHSSEIGNALIACMVYTPALIFGYWLASKQFFEKIPTSIRWCMVYISLAIIALFALQWFRAIYVFRIDFIYVPIFIIAILCLERIRILRIRKIFITIGNVSMVMWFVHALFVMPYCREYTSIITQWAEDSWLMTWLIVSALSFIIAWAINPLLGTMTKKLIKV